MASGGGSKELKAALKKAKEAIKGKDFQQALEHSKVVLQHDPKHYHALVFVGKSATELEQREEAEEAYRKATELEPTQLLAWQGLGALYERIDTRANQESLVAVYQQLMKLIGDDTKERQIAEKQASLYQKLDRLVEASNMLHSLILKSEDGDRSLEKWTKIIQLLTKEKSLEKPSADLLKEAYQTVLASDAIQDEARLRYYQGFISFMLQAEGADVAELKAACLKMHEMYPSEVFPLEKTAEIVLIETYASNASDDWSVYSKLSELDSENRWALIGQAQVKLAGHDNKAAKELLLKVSKKMSMFPLCWLFLARCQLFLHDNNGVECSVKQGIDVLKTYKNPALGGPKQLKEELRVLKGRALISSGLMKDGLRAVELFKKLLPESSDQGTMYQLLTQAHLLAGDISSAQQTFDQIPADCMDSSDAMALDGWMRFHQGELTQAQERIQVALAKEEKSLHHYWLGRVYWAMGGQAVQDKSKCLSGFLKAAKLDPNFSEPFLYLGHHYSQIGQDTVKGKRCYRKAYDLNPASEAAALALGDACDLLDDKDEAISVYTSVTERAAMGGAKWAWLRLGLVQLRAGKATEAVESFQAVLRADPDDKHCQECLAEAYLSRGSYNAALKAFTRVVEMDPSSTYSMFKIGFIKQTLGMYSEAVSDYQAILSQSPDYVPALSGQGETYFLMAKAALHEFFNARAVSYIQQAVTVLTRAILLRADLCGVWKLLGDACTLIAPLHDNLIRVAVNGALLNDDKDSCQTLGKRELLALGGRCYSRAIQRQKECASLWHDLGLNYYHQHRCSQKHKVALGAVQCLKKAITLDKTNHVHWSALGVVAASKAVDDPGLAQHAFIKAIQLEPKSVIAWTNLGALYLSHGNLKLANEAFKVSQSLEPNYVRCWLGQSMIAETLGSEEALDLFRHTTEMSTHVEGGLGYADLVCNTLLDPALNKDSELYRYNITQMAAIPGAMAAVGKAADRLQTSAEAHTLHGILLERQGLHRASEIAYREALQVVKEEGDQERINIALCNHGRALSSVGRAEEARDALRSVTPLVDLKDILSLGLALYRTKEWPEAYLAYEQALELAPSDTEKSQILTALAMVACQAGDLDNAKTLLFKSSQLSASCHQGLVALCALGLQTQDLVLTDAALAELAKQQEPGLVHQTLLHQTVLLTAASKYLQGDVSGACLEATKTLKSHPDDSQLWNLAAEIVLLLDPTDTATACQCSDVARRLLPTHKNVLQVNAAAKLCSGNHGDSSQSRLSPSLIAAQKAVHAMPGDVNNWALLGASCSAQLSWQHVHQQKSDLTNVNSRIARFLLQMSKADSKLAAWVSQHNVFSMLQNQRWQEAENLSKQVLDWCDYGSEANSNLSLLHSLSGWMETSKIGSLGPLRNTVTESQSPLAWQTLGKIYSESKMAAASAACYKQCLQLAKGRKQIMLLHQLAYLAILGLKAGDEDVVWGDLAQQTLDELNKQAPKQPVSHLLKALVYKHQGKQDRQARRELQQGMESIVESGGGGYTQSVLRVHLVEALVKKDKEAAQVLVQDALEQNDLFSSRLETLVSA